MSQSGQSRSPVGWSLTAVVFVAGVFVGAYAIHLGMLHFGQRSHAPLLGLLTALLLLSLALLLWGITGRKAPH